MVNPIIVLTGATGLVGRYVLRRLLQSRCDVAVIVRPGSAGLVAPASAQERARQRVEQVLEPFEVDVRLPRPHVIAWDFAKPNDLNNRLAEDVVQWLSRRPVVVVHCAASIRFQLDKASGEPYRSNVSGVENLLKLCTHLDVRAFHQVSTAYVSQHREGHPVMEQAVATGYLGGNDYESSKIQAERLVLESKHLGQITIHRPSIVVGDSRTGFTSTFHGFYAPLQIGWQFAKTFGYSEQAGQWFRQHLGLTSADSKNLVTVDWVAEGIAAVVLGQLHPANSDSLTRSIPQVVHWTNPKPVGCQEMERAIADAIRRKLPNSGSPPPGESHNSIPRPVSGALALPNADQFKEQMRTYESYFQSDPVFDGQRRLEICGQLNCPEVNYDLLSKLSDWAIDANFGWPKPSLLPLPHQTVVNAAIDFDWLDSQSECTIVKVSLLGAGSPGPFTLGFLGDDCFRIRDDANPHQGWSISLSALVDCVSGITKLTDIFGQGYWVINGKTAGGNLACARIWINHIQLSMKSTLGGLH